jgi:hypothetical protein
VPRKLASDKKICSPAGQSGGDDCRAAEGALNRSRLQRAWYQLRRKLWCLGVFVERLRNSNSNGSDDRR